MNNNIVNLTVVKFRDYNPRKDVEHPSWFRLDYRMVDDPDFFIFTHGEFKAWIYILSVACRKNSDTIILCYKHAKSSARIGFKEMFGAIKKLQSLGHVIVNERRRDADVTPTNATDRQTGETGETGETNGTVSPPQLPLLAEVWNLKSGNLPRVVGCSEKRLRLACARWNEQPDPAYWGAVISKMASSSFCLGSNERKWKADFDFLLQPETRHKVMEGKYDDRTPNGSDKPIRTEAEQKELDETFKVLAEQRKQLGMS